MMMKKLLVLLTVLAMAGTASATMTIVAPVDAMEGSTFGVGLDVVGEVAAITDVIAIAGNVASIDVGGRVLANDVVATPYWEDLSADPDFQAFMNDLGIADTVGIYYYEFVITEVPIPGLTDGSLISGINVTAGAFGNGDIVVALADGANGLLRSSQVVPVVVPEPMTIALLGLGGLFLRRRK
jgi:hypothetical protein